MTAVAAAATQLSSVTQAAPKSPDKQAEAPSMLSTSSGAPPARDFRPARDNIVKDGKRRSRGRLQAHVLCPSP